jgi:hypothetical protein
MPAPYIDSPQSPVWSRRVLSDICVTDWEFLGWFRSPLELSEYLEELLTPVGFEREHRFMAAGASTYRDFQFLFIYDWKPEQIGKSHAPYSL